MPDRSAGAFQDILISTYRRAFSPFTFFILGSSWLVAALAGPFGTYEHLSLFSRTIYWGAIAFFGVALGLSVRAVLFWWLGSENSYRFSLMAACALTVILAPMVIAWRMLMAQSAPGLWVSPPLITFNTFVVAAAIFTFRKFLMPPDEPADEVSEENVSDETSEVRLLRRLPNDIKADILSLSASNHHVDVTTDRGRALVRVRMSDAIDEMEGVEGFCVHRSHWVARDAIREVRRVNAQKIVVVLRNGDELPVSRKYRCNLEKAGLFLKSKAA